MHAEACCIAHVWLRSSNTGSARGATAFLTELQALLPAQLRLRLVRADTGFFEEAILLALEGLRLPYIIAAQFTNRLQAAVYRLTFTLFAPGLEIGEVAYQAHRWTRARRLIAVREELARRPSARGRELFHAPGYLCHTVVTILALPLVDVWHTYNGRADTENRLKELTHAFGADGFSSHRFYATEAALRSICVLCNLLEELQSAPRRTGPPDARHPPGHRVCLRGNPGLRRPLGRSAPLPPGPLAATVPRPAPAACYAGAQLQCG